MIDLKQLEIWFITGSQHLYGPAALKQVATNAQQVVDALDSAAVMPVPIVFKAVVKSPDEAIRTILKAPCLSLSASVIHFGQSYHSFCQISALSR